MILVPLRKNFSTSKREQIVFSFFSAKFIFSFLSYIGNTPGTELVCRDTKVSGGTAGRNDILRRITVLRWNSLISCQGSIFIKYRRVPAGRNGSTVRTSRGVHFSARARISRQVCGSLAARKAALRRPSKNRELIAARTFRCVSF